MRTTWKIRGTIQEGSRFWLITKSFPLIGVIKIGRTALLTVAYWCFWIVVLKTLESPLDYKEIKPVYPKGNQPWIFTGRIDAEAEAPILWPPDVNSTLTGKGPDAGKHWVQEEKGAAEDELARWHHWPKGHEFEQTLGVSEGQGNLACCSLWGRKELEMTERSNNNSCLLF